MNIDDLDKDVYDKFMNENGGIGTLKIRAYAANEALPVAGLNIIVSSVIDNNEVIFFRGVTDTSGMIPNIKLPAPKIDINNLDIPKTINYKITAYMDINNKIYFSINMYDGICVVQNINYIGDIYGS